MKDDMQEKSDKVNRYLENLEKNALVQLSSQLLLYPETKEYIEKSIDEFYKAYLYALRE